MRRSVVAAAAWLVPCVAAADPPTAPITSRDYAIDLYDGVAFGNSATIAMGGAAVANAIGSSGTLVNASASAVRPTTDTDTWSWDYHLDALTSSSLDSYNDGYTTTGGAANRALTGGLALRVRDWAGAATATIQLAPMGAALDAETVHIQFAVARWFPSLDTAIGAAVQTAQLAVVTRAGASTLFDIQGVGLDAGAQWIPRHQDFRVGLAAASSIVGGAVTATGCDPNACGAERYMLPSQVHEAWRVAVGGAFRWADTRWNQLVGGTFRDEPSVTIAADVAVTGPSPNAYGLEAFGLNRLERSGRHAAWSLRGGAEYEWLPGRLRVRAGSYWEPARFDGIGGRIHATFGTEVRVFEFHAWGRRRGRITLTGDVATSYRNLSLSIGLWH